MKFIHKIFVICLFTASFDVVLTVELGGTLHFPQLLMVLVSLAAIGKAAQSGEVLWPAGGFALAIWCLLQIIFLPMSIDLSYSSKYLLLLLFTVSWVYAVVQLYGRSAYLEAMMKSYLYSYVFVAIFGLVQLGIGLLGLPVPFLRQWIVHGRLARINGFSYEPSYYVTYLVMGWIMLLDLRSSGAKIVRAPKWKWITIAMTASFFLSTSKTAWIFCIIEAFARFSPILTKTAADLGTRLKRGSLRIPLPRASLILLGFVFCGLSFGGVIALSRVMNLNIFLSGTGLNNTAAHSLNDRTGRAVETFKVFEEQPWIGRSLGGVSSRIAQRHGVPNDGKQWWGFPVLMDVLAGSGVFGMIPFIVFMGATTVGALGVIRSNWSDERAKWLRALVRAMVYEWLILAADQNLVRVYVWFHLAVLSSVLYHLRHEPQLSTKEIQREEFALTAA